MAAPAIRNGIIAATFKPDSFEAHLSALFTTLLLGHPIPKEQVAAFIKAAKCHVLPLAKSQEWLLGPLPTSLILSTTFWATLHLQCNSISVQETSTCCTSDCPFLSTGHSRRSSIHLVRTHSNIQDAVDELFSPHATQDHPCPLCSATAVVTTYNVLPSAVVIFVHPVPDTLVVPPHLSFPLPTNQSLNLVCVAKHHLDCVYVTGASIRERSVWYACREGSVQQTHGPPPLGSYISVYQTNSYDNPDLWAILQSASLQEPTTPNTDALCSDSEADESEDDTDNYDVSDPCPAAPPQEGTPCSFPVCARPARAVHRSVRPPNPTSARLLVFLLCRGHHR